MVEVSTVESESYFVNPHLASRCRKERQAFCADVGEGHLVQCLQENTKDVSFGAACQLILMEIDFMNKSTASTSSESKRSKKGMNAEDVLLWLQRHGHFEQKQGMVTGAVAGSIVTL